MFNHQLPELNRPLKNMISSQSYRFSMCQLGVPFSGAQGEEVIPSNAAWVARPAPHASLVYPYLVVVVSHRYTHQPSTAFIAKPTLNRSSHV